jgi:hypothetical protein
VIGSNRNAKLSCIFATDGSSTAVILQCFGEVPADIRRE